MGTRYSATSGTRLGVPGLKSGYDGVSTSGDLKIPSVGVEDVDAALFNLFDKEIPFQVIASAMNKQEIKRVPVIFAASEKWALAKRAKGIRDKSGALILPLITVVRTTVQQSPVDDLTGRGINQQTGEMIVRRRLDRSDRSYQSLINKQLISNQLNVAMKLGEGGSDQLTTARDIGSLADDYIVADGGLLSSNRRDNVYETLLIPTPQFFTAIYEVTMWTQYTAQMVQLIDQVMSSFLPQGNAWRLETPKGYWFVATIDGNVFNAENNVEDMSTEERTIKYKFTVKVPAYVLASAVPGAPVPVRRYVSQPVINFDVGVGPGEISEEGSIDDPFLGSDDPTLPLDDSGNRRDDQRRSGVTRLYPYGDENCVDDPAFKAMPRGRKGPRYKKISGIDSNGKTVTKLVRVTSSNRYTGETSFSGSGTSGPDFELGGLTIVNTDDI